MFVFYQITDIFHPPLPSNWGLPDDNRTYCYRQFPKLNLELFGKIRPPKQWSENKQRLAPSAIPTSVLQKQKALFSRAPSLKNLNSFLLGDGPKWVVKVPAFEQRDTEWAIHALSYKFTEENRMEKPLSVDVLGSAQGILLSAHRKQTILLSVIVKLQAFFRMFHVRDSYLRLRMLVIIVQHQRRKILKIREHKNLLNFYIAKVKDVQRIYRGYSTRKWEKKRTVATIFVQRIIRGWLKRCYFLNLKQNTIKAQSYVRGRRARFAKMLILDLVIKLQANVRGFLDRTAIQKFKDKRLLEYRKQMVELWRTACISLEYRSKFWTVVEGTGFMSIGLHEDELLRLWNILNIGKENKVSTNMNQDLNIGSFKGISSTVYQRFLWVRHHIRRLQFRIQFLCDVSFSPLSTCISCIPVHVQGPSGIRFRRSKHWFGLSTITSVTKLTES